MEKEINGKKFRLEGELGWFCLTTLTERGKDVGFPGQKCPASNKNCTRNLRGICMPPK